MGETRKSEYTGEVYGDWTVTGRAPAQNRKRAWHVGHADGTTRVVLQTELPDLGKIVPGGPFVPGIHQAVTDEEKALEAANPFEPVFSGSFYYDVEGVHYTDEDDEPSGPFPPLKAGPGECQHGIPIETCDEHWAMLGEGGKEAQEKYPSKFKGSAEIVQSVLAANALFREAEASVALDNDPEIGTYTFPTTDGVLDWSHAIDLGEARNEPEELAEVIGLGEHADEGVTEEQLDATAAALPKDPVRAAVRKTMGQLFDYKNEIETIHAQLSVAHEHLAELMDSVDGILKAAVTK